MTIFSILGETQPSDERLRSRQWPDTRDLASGLSQELPDEGDVKVSGLSPRLLHLQSGRRDRCESALSL